MNIFRFLDSRRSAPVIACGLMILALCAPSLACARSGARQVPYDLTRLQVLGAVLSRVRTRYVEPRRLNPAKMLAHALKRIQRSVPEVIVRFPSRDVVEVQVNTQRRRFPLSAVDSPWALTTALRSIFRFMQPNLHSDTKRRNVEYAAVDGILETLDCHSVLLRPEFFGEMQIHTRGSFGGLGITISRCGHPQVLTVVKPLEGTPAERAGLRAGDQIVRIESEPTTNLTLNEAVKRLRGRPGSKVTVWIRRGHAAPRKVVIERARVQIRAVDHRMLGSGVGYVRIKTFQSTTDWELRMALQALQRQGLRGLVLDLRGNGGGLLSKAIAVADAFLYSGTIVTTVEHGVKRRESRASWSRTLAGRIPLVVLVDGGTASASEIVSGALKNLDRAVIIGQRTYGKGSVQVIYPNRDRSGFKMTIAQYLTPGDRSIQGVGVIPDIELLPVEVTRKRITYVGSGLDLVREGDRPCSLQRASLAIRTPPRYRLHHLAKELPRGFRCEPCGVGPDWRPRPDPDRFVLDYPVRLGSLVVRQAHTASRRRLLASVRALVQRQRVKQEAAITRRLARVAKVDWTPAPRGARPAKLSASVQVGRNGVARAGDVLDIRITVRNAPGAGTAYRLHGLIDSSHPLLQHREFFFGRLAPGARRTAHVRVMLPKGVRHRADVLSARFFLDGGTPPPKSCAVFRVKERPKPKFVYTRQILDDIQGNRDGRLQPGETVRLRVTVRNVGAGTAGEAYLRLKSLSGDAVSVRKGVYVLSGLRPGASRRVDLEFRALSRLPLPRVKLKLFVSDCQLGVSTGETLTIPVAPASSRPDKATGLVAPRRAGTPIYASVALLHVVGRSAPGARFLVEGRQTVGTARVLRVTLGKGQFGFLRRADVRRLGRGRPRPLYRPRWLPERPEISLESVPDVTRSRQFTVAGKATGGGGITDVYVSVRRLLRTPDRSRVVGVDYNKVFYRAAVKGVAPSLPFRAVVPLWLGSNLVTVTARNRDRTVTERTFRVLRTRCGSLSRFR